MIKPILKSIAMGVLIGTAFFFAPILIIGAFIFFLIFRLMIGRRFRNGHYTQYRLAFADKIRTMSEEDYEQYKTNSAFNHGCKRRK